MNSTEDFENKDVFDSRDIEDRIEELKDILNSNVDDDKENLQDEIEELKELETLRDDVGSCEWDFGITFIHEDYFDEYAEDFFNEIYTIPDNISSYIDYEKFSNDLKHDYSVVEFRGKTFYYRGE